MFAVYKSGPVLFATSWHTQSTTGCHVGVARSGAASAVPFIIESDLQLVAVVESGSKTLMSLADLVCHVCRTQGVTVLNLMEHDMVQKSQDLWFVLLCVTSLGYTLCKTS